MSDTPPPVVWIFAVCIGLSLSVGLLACDSSAEPACDDDSDCFSSEICEDGVCQPQEQDAGNDNGEDADSGGSGCEDGQLSCGGQCFDAQTDPDHCGTCDNRCEDELGDNEVTSCAGGSCHYECAAGFTRCDGECVEDPGRCAVELSLAGHHSCVRFESGAVHCWGNNYHGQLGDGTTEEEQRNPVKVQDLTDAVSVSAGPEHSCAVTESGEVRCWGSNDAGQLGHGGPTEGDDARHSSPVTVDGISSATAIAAGSYHSCAVLEDGGVQCWGDNYFGQLGDGNGGQDTEVISTTPVDVLQISSAVDVSVGLSHSCARLDDGGVQCWGSNEDGQLGNGDEDHETSVIPDEVVGLSDVIDIAVGSSGEATCAITEEQTLYCWGKNNQDIFGEDVDLRNESPIEVQDFASVAQVGVGTLFYSFICVRLDDGIVHCWGSNRSGNLGDGSSDSKKLEPVNPALLGPTVELAVGDVHACAITEGDEFDERGIKCWGSNFDGQIGDGTPEEFRDTPVWVNW